MRFTFTIILVISIMPILASSKIDSLKNRLQLHTKEDTLKVELLNTLGYEYWITDPVQSIIYGQQAKVLAEIINDSSGIAYSNRVIGVAHWARGSYDKGLEYLFNGLSMYRNLYDSIGEANCLLNIGLIYSDRWDNDLALEYYFEALKLFDATNAQNRSASTYINISTILIRQKKFTEAYDFLGKAKYIHGSGRFFYGMSGILNRYGLLKIEMKQYDSARLYLEHALGVSRKIDDLDGIARNYIDLAQVASLTANQQEAEDLLLEGLETARKIQSHKWLKEIYSQLQLIARDKGDLARAIYYYDQYVKENDSIFSEQVLNNISRLETEFATAEQKRQLIARENEIIFLEQEREIQNTRILILAILMIAVVISAILIIRNRQLDADRKEQKALKEADEAKKELEFKKRELVSYTVNFVRKNQLFEELTDTVSKIKETATSNHVNELMMLERTIKKYLQIDKNWEDFKVRFENLHTGFFDKVLSRESSLTGKDLRLCALVKMSFSIKEISDMMGISTESVKTARYRLKKKLNLPEDVSINDFLNTIS